MKLITKVFRRSDWYVTSAFGYRIHPITGEYTFHAGVDYGTNVEKWAQYAVEDGYIQLVNENPNAGYGKYVWVRYPRINKSLFHAHLDSINVSVGQTVKEGTLIGYTGTTGNSTGIHLHLGMTDIGSDTWQDVHAYDYQPITPVPTLKFKIGDIVRLNGSIYIDSYGNGKTGDFKDYKVTIGNINNDIYSTTPYYITELQGWVKESDLMIWEDVIATPPIEEPKKEEYKEEKNDTPKITPIKENENKKWYEKILNIIVIFLKKIFEK